jgi:aminocarboxymuconate-semialdehyde decarboxylase
MSSRREFLKRTGAATGVVFFGCWMHGAAQAQAAARLPVMVGGKRVKTVDVHSHCLFHEALNLLGNEARLVLPPTKGVEEHFIVIDERLKAMDAMGIDMEVLSINPFWYRKERDLAADIVRVQNEKVAELTASRPDRFVAFASPSLQFPELAVEQLERAIKQQGLKGAAIGGSVGGRGFFLAALPPGLGEGGGTRRGVVHSSAEHAGARAPVQGQWLAVQHDRQPARYDDCARAPDLRGHP